MSLPQWQEIKALQYQALATATYVANMWLIKMSIAIFLLRIAIQRRYQYTIYVSMGVVTVWSLALFFWDVFQCNPVEADGSGFYRGGIYVHNKAPGSDDLVASYSISARNTAAREKGHSRFMALLYFK